jgi:broad specificity phosphatase PhoE
MAHDAANPWDMVVVHLVRHAPPRIDRSAPPWEWTLAPSAAETASRLRDADVLPRDAWWVSSSEPKAVQTARLLTDLEVRLDPDLREAARDPVFLGMDEFNARVLRSFESPEAPAATGWEPLTATRSRVLLAAERAVEQAAGRDVVLVGHGTALTMLVSALRDEPPDVPAWVAMRFPDHCALVLQADGPALVAAAWGAWGA